MKRIKVVQNLENGGLNMIDTKLFFNSLHARWITRILEADTDGDSWVQIPRLLLGSVHVDGYNMRLNFDESVCFPQVESLLSFYKNALQCFSKAYVSDESTFQQSILNQPLWGNKYITHYVGCEKSVLFLRNWIRSGFRVVSDLPFINGILDENAMYTMLDNKKNMYCEVMLIKTALYPYRMNIVNGNNESLIPIKPLKSKEYYNVFLQQLACNANITPVTKYLDSYCNNNDEILAFSKKVVLENEIKLKEFNFKVLHGILACNKNLKNWKIRLNVFFFVFFKGTIVSDYGKFIANYQRFRYRCIQIHTNARMHTRKHAHTHPHKHRHTDTQAQKQDKEQFYQIQLYNAHKFSISASKFIFSFIVNFVHNS